MVKSVWHTSTIHRQMPSSSVTQRPYIILLTTWRFFQHSKICRHLTGANKYKARCMSLIVDQSTWSFNQLRVLDYYNSRRSSTFLAWISISSLYKSSSRRSTFQCSTSFTTNASSRNLYLQATRSRSHSWVSSTVAQPWSVIWRLAHLWLQLHRLSMSVRSACPWSIDVWAIVGNLH